MHKLPNLLKSRHGVFYLRTFANGKEQRQSLRTKDWHVAKLHALQFNLDRAMNLKKFDLVFPGGVQVNNINTDDDVTRVQKLFDDPNVKYLLQKAQELKAAAGAAPSSTVAGSQSTLRATTALFSAVVPLYTAEKALLNTQKTLEEKKGTYAEFERLFGDADMGAYASENAITFKNRMISDGLNALRINKKLSFMNDLFVYAIANKMYFAANPFEGLSISSKAKSKKAMVESYEPFTDDELKLIFENPKYATFMNKPDYFWLPFLALYTGARLESLASLKVSQVCKDGRVWFFDIVKDKNANSKRKVPLHERIVSSKFLTYVESVKSAGQVQLFPHLKPGANGYSKNCSRRFGDYLDTLKITDPRKVFHSLRVCFINSLTNTGVHAAIIMGLVGHYDQSKIDFSSTHFKTYQKYKPLEIMKDCVDKLTYDIAFSSH